MATNKAGYQLSGRGRTKTGKPSHMAILSTRRADNPLSRKGKYKKEHAHNQADKKTSIISEDKSQIISTTSRRTFPKTSRKKPTRKQMEKKSRKVNLLRK